MVKEKIGGGLYFMCGLALGIVIAFLLGCFVAGITAQPVEDVGSGVPLPSDGCGGWSSVWCMHRANSSGDMNWVVGWNLIGICTNNVSMASELASSISGCSIISRFDSGLQEYRSFFVGGPMSFDFPLSCGMGVFVLVDS